MNISQAQYQQLLTHLVAHVNQVLSQQGELSLLGLLLDDNQEITMVTDVAEINLLQQQLTTKVEQDGYVAAGISYPDFENDSVITYLETNRNDCAQFTIPVNINATPVMNIKDVVAGVGVVCIFADNK